MATTGGNDVIGQGAQTGWSYSCLELSPASTGRGFVSSGAGAYLNNMKISASSGNAIVSTANGLYINATEISGGADGVNVINGAIVANSYIHGVSGDCIEIGGTFGVVINSILSGCGGNGINFSSGPSSQSQVYVVYGNTIYNNGANGVIAPDADLALFVENNIFQENGNAAGEYNVNWSVAGTAEWFGFHGYNLFYHSNCQGSASSTTCVNGLTANSTEVGGTNAGFTNAGSGDFSISSSSPAYKTGNSGAFPGGTSTGYISMGAVQPNPASGGGARSLMICGSLPFQVAALCQYPSVH